MTWDGIERRKEQRAIAFCPAHIELVEDLAIIKTSLQNIEKTIIEGATFRRGIVTAMISMALIIVLQIVSFAFLMGGINKQIEVNTGRISIIEETFTRIK